MFLIRDDFVVAAADVVVDGLFAAVAYHVVVVGIVAIAALALRSHCARYYDYYS